MTFLYLFVSFYVSHSIILDKPYLELSDIKNQCDDRYECPILEKYLI